MRSRRSLDLRPSQMASKLALVPERSAFADLHRFVKFAAEFVDLTGVRADLTPRVAC